MGRMEVVMEWIILVVIFLLAPIVLSITAMVRTSNLTREIEKLRSELRMTLRKAPAVAPVKTTPAPKTEPAPAVPALPVEKPTPIPPPEVPVIEAEQPSPSNTESLEATLGGKVAPFAGIAALVAGVVFFIGYAIQHAWIGPGLRIVLGLLAGGLLVGLGHAAEVKNKNLRILARALTGGGAALFYFCVFSAHGIYHLIGWPLAGIGLLASAAATLSLSVVYNSQAIALLGVLGAFITPLLIQSDMDRGLFPLVFITVVNIPVIALGLKQKWQALYNLAFLFTVGFAIAWLDREIPGDWVTGLIFVVLFFLEFVTLGLLKLTHERTFTGRHLDLLRLLLCSLGLLGALYWILKEAGHEAWTGSAFVAAALVHVAFARIGWKWFPKFKDEILTLLIGALTFASMALPVQLDGVWVSLGWGIEGLILAWFALRIGSVLLQAGAVFLGLLGLLKSIGYDVTLYATPPQLFINGRFAVGMVSAILLGLQGRLNGRKPESTEGQTNWSPVLLCFAIAGIVVVFFADTFTSIHWNDPLAGLLTTLALLAIGALTTLGARPQSMPWGLGVILIALIPFKLLVFDLGVGWHNYCRSYPLFFNAIFLPQMAALLAASIWLNRLSRSDNETIHGGFTLGHLLNITSLLAGITMVSLEISRSKSPWNDSLITLLWASSALALTVTGLVRQRAYLRYLALLIFGVTVIKVFVVDLGGLAGLQRVAAFMGVGVLLLILSFAYQRVAPVLLKRKE